MDHLEFLKRISQHIKNTTTPKVKVALDQFLDQCTYVSGVYDQDGGFQDLEKELKRIEHECKVQDRLFYMALPPSVFIPVANGLKKNCYTPKGINRLIVEKPFGMDLESSRTLSKALGALYREDEVSFFFLFYFCSLDWCSGQDVLSIFSPYLCVLGSCNTMGCGKNTGCKKPGEPKRLREKILT